MSLDLSYLGITATKEIYRNLPVAILTERRSPAAKAR